MLAIGHATTALLIKRRFPQVPMGWLLFSVELPGLVWLLLGAAGIERGTAFMPYSHSAASGLVLAGGAWLLLGKAFRRRALAAAVATGVLAHLLLDFGMLGLHETPALATAVAVAYGLLCWLVFRGGKALLAVIVMLNLAYLSFLQSPLAVRPDIVLAAGATHLVLAVALVWYFSRKRAAELEHPDTRLARAFA